MGKCSQTACNNKGEGYVHAVDSKIWPNKYNNYCEVCKNSINNADGLVIMSPEAAAKDWLDLKDVKNFTDLQLAKCLASGINATTPTIAALIHEINVR